MAGTTVIKSHFTKNESLCLLQIFCSDNIQKQFKNLKKSHVSVWENVSLQMGENNYNRSSRQCKERVKNLKAEFFKRKRMPSGSGQDNWPYFEMFSKLLGESAICKPVMVVDSLDEDVLEK